MPPKIATLLFVIGIIGLFRLNRDREAQTSKALWVPVIWMSIACSRAISQWLSAFGFAEGTSIDSPDQYLEGSPLDRNVYIGLLLIGLIVLLKRGRRVGPILRANAPILLFLFYCAVSFVWSDFPDVTFKRWIKALGDVVMVMIVLTDPQPISAIKRLLARAGFVMVPLSVLFIKYYPDLGRFFNSFSWTINYTGVTTFKNLLGMICLVLGIGAVWCLLQGLRQRNGERPTGPLIAQAVLLLMMLWLFWMAGSMTSLACFLMATGLIAATNLSFVRRKPWVVHVLVAAIITVSFSALFLNAGGDLLQTVGRDPTLTGRTEIWSLVLGMTRNPMVGTGFESFWLGERLEKIWSVYWWHPNEAHNGYLELYLNLGWIGVTLFAIVLITGYRNVIRAFRRDPDLGSLGVAYFVVAVAYNFTESATKAFNPVWITFLMSIVALPSEPISEDPPPVGSTDSFAESKPEADHMVSVRLRQQNA
jgi:O-antigen ligase